MIDYIVDHRHEKKAFAYSWIGQIQQSLIVTQCVLIALLSTMVDIAF